VDQLTPSSGVPSPWTRTGTVVALNAAGDTDIDPFTDNATDVGKNAKRWKNVVVSGEYRVSDGVNVLSALTNAALAISQAGDASPRIEALGSGSNGILILGDGTGVNDVQLTRVANRELRVIANSVQRLESTFEFKTVRVAAGAGNDVFVTAA